MNIVNILLNTQDLLDYPANTDYAIQRFEIGNVYEIKIYHMQVLHSFLLEVMILMDFLVLII